MKTVLTIVFAGICIYFFVVAVLCLVLTALKAAKAMAPKTKRRVDNFLAKIIQWAKKYWNMYQRQGEWTSKELDNIIAKVIDTSEKICQKLGKYGIVTGGALSIPLYTMLNRYATEHYLKQYNIQFVNVTTQNSMSILILGVAYEIIIFIVLYASVWIGGYLQKDRPIDKKTYLSHGILAIIAVHVMLAFLMIPKLYQISNGFHEKFDESAKILLLKVYLILMAFGWLAFFILFLQILFSTKNAQPTTKKFIQISVSAVLTSVLSYGCISLQINQEIGSLRTVHIQATDEIKVWTENTPIADDGKQIWAVIYESKDFYFVEPLTIGSETNDEYEYTVDKDHYMALNKADVIIYNKTVGDLNDEIEEKDKKSMECK